LDLSVWQILGVQVAFAGGLEIAALVRASRKYRSAKTKVEAK